MGIREVCVCVFAGAGQGFRTPLHWKVERERETGCIKESEREHT